MIVLWDNFLSGSTGTGTSLIDYDSDTNFVLDYYNQGYTNAIMIDPTYGPEVGILPYIYTFKDTILMGYKGYSILKSSMILADENIEQLPLVTLTYNTWDNDAEQQFPSPLSFSQDFEDDYAWNTIVLETAATDVILMSYYGYSVLPGSKQDQAEWTNYIATPSIVDYTWDLDNYQMQWSDYSRDQSYEGVETSLIITLGWDNDENQFQRTQVIYDQIEEQAQLILLEVLDEPGTNPLNTGYTFDGEIDTGVEYAALTGNKLSVWDTDADVQFQQAAWQQDGDVDTEITRVIIPTEAYDNDSDNQLQQAAWSLDVLDERNELPIIPVMELDTDAMYQLSSPLPFGQDTLSDENVEKITLPPILATNTWDDPADNQLQQADWYKDVLPDETVELITLPKTGWDNDAENQRQHDTYLTDRDTADTGVESLQYSAGVLRGWDTDSDQQILQLGLQLDNDLSDNSVERIQLPAITNYTYDIDENRVWVDQVKDQADDYVEYFIAPIVFDTDDIKLWIDYQLDRDIDTSVELVLLTVQEELHQQPWIQKVLDQVEEQAQLVLLTVLDDIQDKFWDKLTIEQIYERNNLPIIPVMELDTDSDQQKLQPEYYKDHLSDEETEKITIPPTVPQLTAFDTDSEYQSQWIPNFEQDFEDDWEWSTLGLGIAAADVILMSYYGYSILPATKDQSGEWTQYIVTITPPVIDTTFDNDSDQQMYQFIQLNDDLSDSSTEIIILPPFINIEELLSEEDQ